MTEQEDRIKECFLNLLGQACGESDPSVWEDGKCVKESKFKGYDSLCISSYEDAIDLAVELGWIKQEEVLR